MSGRISLDLAMCQVDALIGGHKNCEVVFISPPVRVALHRQKSLVFFLEQKTAFECDLLLISFFLYVSVPNEAVNFVVIRYEQEIAVVCQDLVF